MYDIKSLTTFHTAYHNPQMKGAGIYMRMQMLPGPLWDALKKYPNLEDFLAAYANNQYDLQGNPITSV